MHFEMEIAGRIRRVTIEPRQMSGPDGGQMRVRVDDAVYEVDVQRVEHGLSLVFGDGRSVAVALTAQGPGRWLAQLPHVALTAVLNGRAGDPSSAGGAAALHAGEVRLTAPMPGRIGRVLVSVGDEVAARQGLVVIEAMKMENELGAPRAGRVKEIHVTPGTPVEAGRLLVVLG